MTYSISFDPESLQHLAAFAGFQAIFAPEIQAAMSQAGDLLTTAAQAMTWQVFANPSGTLAGTIHPMTDTPYSVVIVADAPHARRRELGFSGKTDSLGRYYPNDPAKPYMAPALAQNEAAILDLIGNAVDSALSKL